MRKKMRSKNSLLLKMLLSIGLSIAIIFCASMAVVLSLMKQSVNQLTSNQLTTESQAASYQINNYFSKYIEAAEQMATSTQFQDIFLKATPQSKMATLDGFKQMEGTLKNVQSADSENIVCTWAADDDTSQFIESDDYLSGDDWDITSRAWYKQITESKSTVVTEPYQVSSTNSWSVSIVAPVYQPETQELLGFIGIDFSLDQLYQMVSSYKLDNTGFYMLATSAGTLIYHPDQDLKEKNVTESGMSSNVISAITNKKEGAVTYTAMGQTNYGYVSTIGDTGWTVTTGLPEKEFNSTLNTVLFSIIIIFFIALAVMFLIIAFVSRSMVNPLKNLKNVAQKIADGNLDVQMEVKSNDEIGQVATAFSQTVDRLKQYMNYIDEVSAVLEQIAKGNLVFELQYDYTGDFSKIKTALDYIKDTLVDTFSQIENSADQVASGADQVSNASQALAQGATQQASAIQELSASITEIEGEVRTNASNAVTATELANQSFAEVKRGNEHMRQMIAAMDEISKSSNEIGKIIKAIEDIAFQTNILSLNAAVEAARAGTAGKGFAVVADEVRNLANKSAEAVNNTTALIETSISSVQNGTKIAREAEESLNKIYDGTQQTTDLIEKISDASNQQATSIQQVTQGVEQISAVVQTNSATSEESAASSEELTSQAHTLKDLVKYFKI